MGGHPTQWGSSARLIGSNIPNETRHKTAARLVDVRLPTTTDGWMSRDCTLYTYAKVIHEGSVGLPLTAAINCTLFTGMGGLTNKEDFLMPGVGRAIHIVADSVRLNCEIGDNIQASYEVFANVGTGGLYSHDTQKLLILYDAPPDWTLYTLMDIPRFCTFFKILAPNPQLLTITPYFEGAASGMSAINGLEAVEFTPIPLLANQLYVESVVNQTIYIVLTRPS